MAVDDLEMLVRSMAGADLAVRSDGDGRTIHGLAVPYGVDTAVRDSEGDYRERFARGAFAQTIRAGKPHRVKLFVRHDRGVLPVGAASELVDDEAGLLVGLRVASVPAGDEALELVRAGALDQLSVGFRPVCSVWSDKGSVSGMRHAPAQGATVERTEARLDEVSLVDFAAYPAAEVTGVRGTSDSTAEQAAAVVAAANMARRRRATATLDLMGRTR